MKVILPFIIYFFTTVSSFAQANATSRAMDNLYTKAKSQMKEGSYEAASTTFRLMLDKKDILPTDMAFHFAETLYMIGQYQNSKSFIQRYLNITGRGGEFYSQAIELQGMLALKSEEIKTCNLCNSFGYRLETCHTCHGEESIRQSCPYCKGKGISVCTACDGDGVIISRSNFKEIYKSCHVCDSKGYVTCPTCMGAKEINGECPTCHGQGKTSSTEICDHKQKNGTF